MVIYSENMELKAKFAYHIIFIGSTRFCHNSSDRSLKIVYKWRDSKKKY